jgi:hypothetical protein
MPKVDIRTMPLGMLRIFRRIYTQPASVVIITGNWKLGKTDFGFFNMEILKALGLIREFASNAQTMNVDDFPMKHIEALNQLKAFGTADRHSKLFMYDEVIESTPTRSAMSKLNVGWVRFIPQLSKMHMHLLVLTQVTQMADSVFMNPVFCRGVWRKTSLTTAEFSGRDIVRDVYKVSDVPRTSIAFDPDLIATFKLEETSMDFKNMPLMIQVASLYGDNMSFPKIGEKLGLHRQQIKREIMKVCRFVSHMSPDNTDGLREIPDGDDEPKKIYPHHINK